MMSKKGYKFNTFYGVVVPSTLAILGAVMYFILPQVLGSVGLFNTILIIILAHTITVVTAFSISSIASNIDVKEGGLYYMVSRSLGREFGGSTGILLYFAQTISIAFYAAAFARAIHGVLLRLSISFSEFHLSLLSFIFFGILSFRGARKVLNMQTVILAIILLSLASIFSSAHDPQAGTSFVQLLPFWVAFAMFFPAVTGIDAGVGMSGDLKHPRKSLIKGTFIAIGFTFIIYILLSLKLSMMATPAAMVENKHILETVAAIPFMVVIGALLATGSSVLSLSMTAPRTLRALVLDRMLPTRLNILSRSFSSKSTDPHFALLFTFVLGGGVLFMGSLEFISQVLTILFLSAYSWINFSVIMERFSKNPSFRPQFKIHWSVPLYGVIACYVIMFFFNAWIALAVIMFQLLISLFVASHKRSPDSIDGIWDGVFFRIVRNVLGREGLGSVNAKNYRLTVLAFSISKRHRRSLVTLMDWITAQSSLSKFFILLPGRLSSRYKYGEREHERFKRFVASKQIRLFSRSIVTTDYQSCIRDVVQSEGLGGLDLNTVLFDMEESIQLNKLIPDIVRLKKNVVVMKDNHGLLTKKNTFQTIDVWWNSKNNGNFMLLIAYLISQSYPWKKHKPVIRVFKIISSSKYYHSEYSSLKKVIDESRIAGVQMKIVTRNGRKIREVMRLYSQNSDLVILGLPHFNDSSSKLRSIAHARAYSSPFRASLIVRAHDEIDLRKS